MIYIPVDLLNDSRCMLDLFYSRVPATARCYCIIDGIKHATFQGSAERVSWERGRTEMQNTGYVLETSKFIVYLKCLN